MEVKLSEYEGPGEERSDRNRVLLSQYFLDSYKANYLKNIDARLYWSLSSPIAKRLYRLIDKKRNGRRMWEVELFSLKDRIPLSNYKYASKVRRKLAPDICRAPALWDFPRVWARLRQYSDIALGPFGLAGLFSGMWLGAASHTFTDLAGSYVKTGRVSEFL